MQLGDDGSIKLAVDQQWQAECFNFGRFDDIKRLLVMDIDQRLAESPGGRKSVDPCPAGVDRCGGRRGNLAAIDQRGQIIRFVNLQCSGPISIGRHRKCENMYIMPRRGQRQRILPHGGANAAHAYAGPLRCEKCDPHVKHYRTEYETADKEYAIDNRALMTSELRETWDDVAAELTSIPLVLEHPHYAAAIKPLTTLPKSSDILEAGCGAGRILRSARIDGVRKPDGN